MAKNSIYLSTSTCKSRLKMTSGCAWSVQKGQKVLRSCVNLNIYNMKLIRHLIFWIQVWEKLGTYHFYQVFADGIFGFWSIYSNNNNTWKNTATRLAFAYGLLVPIPDYDSEETATAVACLCFHIALKRSGLTCVFMTLITILCFLHRLILVQTIKFNPNKCHRLFMNN